ncbi:MAG TPA: signal peptidase II [Vicinamibacterales bacterium]|nr:signal peptidase II [Vicinamibacterales bacterium]
MARSGRLTILGARVLLCVLVAATIGCDRVSKQLAVTNLAGAAPRSMLGGTVRLEYTENAGGFLSLGADWPVVVRTTVFTGATGLGLVGLAAFAYSLRRRWWPLVGLTLFVAGGLSNWVDRVVAGHVVDFMIVGYGPLRTGVFNVADVALMLGAAIFAAAETQDWISRRTRYDRPA